MCGGERNPRNDEKKCAKKLYIVEGYGEEIFHIRSGLFRLRIKMCTAIRWEWAWALGLGKGIWALGMVFGPWARARTWAWVGLWAFIHGLRLRFEPNVSPDTLNTNL